MISTRPREPLGRRLGARFAPAALLVLAVCAVEARVQAQGFGPDPFRPYNSQYDAYVFGVAPGSLDPVGNPTLNRAGVRGANQFQNFVAGMEGRANAGNRYDRANRAYDTEYGRLYRPNAEADARFEKQRNAVSDVYFQYLSEKDPRKRAALFKQYTQAQSRASRDLASDPHARGARRSRSADEPPPPPRLGPDRSRRAADAVPPPGLSDEPDSAVDSPRSRRRPTAVDIPRPPSGAPSPSEVLERATRSDADAPPPPTVP